MNRYKKLFSNSVVFAIGNLGSKIITFFMVPLYTRYLTTSQYGQSDLISTLVSLLTPILTLSVIDAVFRFSMDNTSNNSKVLTNGFVVSTISFIIFLILSPIIVKLQYGFFICFLTYVSALESMLQQFARGIGRSKLYAFTGIFMTILTVVSNIIFLIFMGWQLEGYLLSLLIAQIGGILLLFCMLRCWKFIGISNFDFGLIKNMLSYSVPMIPNTISWWLSNSANKIFISMILSTAANGLYAVANKIPSLISVFVNIFTQAWQISAIEEYKSDDSGKFFSGIMNLTVEVLFIGVGMLTLVAKPIILILSTADYISAWKIVPFLALAVLYSSLASFLGTIYTATMQTKYLFITTLCGAVTNVVLNIIFIPILGIVGSGISACISFMVVSFMRINDSKKFISLKINKMRWGILQILVLIEIGILYSVSGFLGYTLAAVIVLILTIMNVHVLTPLKSVIEKRFERK